MLRATLWAANGLCPKTGVVRFRVHKAPLMGTRAGLTLGRGVITKQYRDPADATAEIHWYQHLAGHRICPRLIDANPDTGTLVLATHPPAGRDYRPVRQLADLLYELESLGIAHRDVHPGNILAGPRGPLLIDWETAIHAPGAPSYDLHGPDASGVAVPSIHQALRSRNSPHGYIMWWASDHRRSIRNQWGADVPARMA